MSPGRRPKPGEPTLSVIVPAYNEEPWLPATLAALQEALAQLSVPAELIVVDNNSSDGTAALARSRGARVVFEPVNQIARARNTGARHARGAYLLFVDADTHVSAALLQQAVTALQDGQCCGGGAPVAFEPGVPSWAQWGLAAWNGVSRRLHVAAGAFIFCLREGFEAVGGFNEAVYASEEVWLSRRLRAWGRRRGQAFIILDTPVVTSGRKLEWYSPLQQFALLLMLLVFPFAVRFRSLSGFWYRRPRR